VFIFYFPFRFFIFNRALINLVNIRPFLHFVHKVKTHRIRPSFCFNRSTLKTILTVAAMAASTSLCLSVQEPPKPNVQMQAVLNQVGALGGKPIELALDEAPDAYKHFDERENGWTKVILHPHGI
jgi:hypothetical protein